MLRNIFTKSLRDQRKSLIFWCMGVAGVGLVTLLFFPSFKDSTELSDLFEDADVLARVFAGGFTDLASAEGFVNSQLYSLMVPILFIVFAIAQGSGAIAGEEESGTLDILLSEPKSRLQVIVHKSGAMLASIALLGVVLWASVIVGSALVGAELGVAGVTAASFSGMLLGTLFGVLALALGSFLGKRGLSIAISGVVAVTSYFIYALTPLVDGLEHASKLSPFHYYITADPLSNGLNPLHAGVLVALAIALFAGACIRFQQRDLAV